MGIRLQDVIHNIESVEAFILFRHIEDWCRDNIPPSRWRFDYSSTICVFGVDCPGRIIFKCSQDMNTFILKFGVAQSLDTSAIT
jgi:hypothetical protein